MKRSGKDILAVACLVASVICWGVPPIMLRYIAERHIVRDGITTNFIRYPVATILYIPLLIAAHRRGVRLGSFWKWALLPAVVNIIGQTLFAIAPYYMGAGLMSFLLRLSTIWSVLLAFMLFKDERVLARNPRFWLAATMAVGGFLLMAVIGRGRLNLSAAAVIMILVCSLFWGLYDVTVRYTMGKLHPLIVFGVIGNYTSVGLVLLAPAGHPADLRRLNAAQWALVIGSAYIGITAAHSMYYVALQRLGVAVSSVTMLLSPLVAFSGSALLLGERFTTLQWCGGALLISGATLALWTRFETRRIAPAEEAAAGSPD